MKIIKKLCAASALALTASSAFAGGLLTNTNQGISFLRNPARDGAIGIDGVYSNPAGVAFLGEGFHLGLNWQSAWQTRTIETRNEMLAYGYKNNGLNTKTYEGKAQAPFIPSINAVYNKDKWSYQFNFAVTGGGGKCTFDNGIGSFETAVGAVGFELNKAAEQMTQGGIMGIPSVTGYDANSYMQGSQFYFGFTLGAAYKITNNLSAYAGVRALYGNASYKAKISDIKVLSDNNTVYTLPEYINKVSAGIQGTTEYVVGQYMAAGLTYEQAMQQAKVQTLVATGQAMAQKAEVLAAYYDGVNLQSDQSGVGFAPIFGLDYKGKNFNVAAKYEFRTAMSMKNKSTVLEASQIAAVNQFKDGTSVREDQPALLTLGAQYSVLPTLRVNAGWHHFFDKASKKTYCYTDANGTLVTDHEKNKLLNGDTNEYLGGVEWDTSDKLTLSSGFQITKYGMSDEYMSDMSFVVDSWSFGVGAKYKVNDKLAVQVAYFQTNYGHYKTAEVLDERGNIKCDDYTRTNKVVGIGVEYTF